MVFVRTGSNVAVSMSAVHLAQNDVDAPDARDRVGDHASDAHVLERLEVDEGRRPDSRPVRNRSAVAYDVEAKLPLLRFDREVGVPRRGAVAFRHDLEMIDQLLHVELYVGPVRREEVGIVAPHGPRAQTIQTLAHDRATVSSPRSCTGSDRTHR